MTQKERERLDALLAKKAEEEKHDKDFLKEVRARADLVKKTLGITDEPVVTEKVVEKKITKNDKFIQDIITNFNITTKDIYYLVYYLENKYRMSTMMDNVKEYVSRLQSEQETNDQ